MKNESGSIKAPIWIGIVAGAVLGAIVGAITNLSIRWGILLGAVIGSLVGWLAPQRTTVPNHGGITGESIEEEKDVSSVSRVTLKLREEELDISKTVVPTGRVSVRKEAVTEAKNVSVPLTREELIIEKTILENNAQNQTEPVTETIRIPLREERIEVIKNLVELEDVRVHPHQFQTTEVVTANVKKEHLEVNTTGDARVITEENDLKSKNHN